MEDQYKLGVVVLVLLTCGTVPTNCRHIHHWQWQPWRHDSESGQGSSRGVSSVMFQVKDLLPIQTYPIHVQCEEGKMVVTVQRDLFRNGKLVKPSDLTLGPQHCSPSSQTQDTVIFQNGLQDCGNHLQMTSDWLIYSTNLTHNPTPSLNTLIVRTNAANVPIQCYYPRHSNVSTKPVKPTWTPFSSTVFVEKKLSFSLKLMSDDWNSPKTSNTFQLGDMFNIEASIDTRNHVPMTIFVDRCVATVSADVNSSPRYEILALYGCLLDSKLEDSSSVFWSPRPSPDKLRFKVDAFRFVENDSSLIYITCTLRATAVDQNPDAMNKACSYNKRSNTWSSLNGPNNICDCCGTGDCGILKSRAIDPESRRLQRSVEADSGPRAEQVAIGPLFIIDSRNLEVPAENEDTSRLIELWLLVATCGLCFVLTSVCITRTIRGLNKKSYIFTHWN
ncbi:hypothetical protein GDO86_020391 [Hymenochirus boettgeri]|uniref:Zona pellucida sperm-binding protein 3 n=1 Tax=Hymenochirus boettgeri TaxID=247094 RepID=A0A8T2IFH1_9PIPI|nr:hypothetical protein GDO86_020391 [Hymenochirus boettgeri]